MEIDPNPKSWGEPGIPGWAFLASTKTIFSLALLIEAEVTRGHDPRTKFTILGESSTGVKTQGLAYRIELMASSGADKI